MAQRPIVSQRDVISQSYEQDQSIVPQIGLKAVEIAGNIMRQNAEAKIVENISKAQLDLNALTNQFQIQNESNPVASNKDFAAQKKALFDKYAQDIPANYRFAWDKQVNDLSMKNELQNQTWALKQARTNTVNSINTAMKSSYMQSYLDGKNIGEADTTDLSAIANFAQTKANLMDFGIRNLGEETTKSLLNEYDNVSMKYFLSGVIETNPRQALLFLDEKYIQSVFDPKDYDVMKKAAENRVLRLDEVRQKNQIIESIKAPNSLLAQAQTRQLSIAEIEQASRQYGLDESTKEYLLKRSGYSKKEISQETGETKPVKLSSAGKLEMKADIYDAISRMTKAKEITPENIDSFQKMIYSAMNAGAITEKEGMGYISQMIEPIVAEQQKNLSSFSVGEYNPFVSNRGFSQIEEMYETEIKQPYPKGETKEDPLVKATNLSNKALLYDNYFKSVTELAEKNGIRTAEINKLSYSAQSELYDQAFNNAKTNYLKQKNAKLSELTDIPNQVLSNGKIIAGMAGKRDVKPDFSVTGKFKIMQDKYGNKARVYDDGKIEELN